MGFNVPATASAPPQSSPSGGLETERWLAAIVESSDDAILGKSLDGIITSWNRGATRVFGYEADEAIGRHISFLAWPGEEGQIESFLEQLGRGERVDHFEVARRHKTGRKIFVSLSLSPVFDNNNKIIGIAKIARDITGRKAAEEKLEADKRYLQLVSDQKETPRQTQIKQDYLIRASHELRTPLHAIMGFSELLADHSYGSLNPKQERFLHHIRQGSGHLLTLINDILDLNRLEAGGLLFEPRSLSVVDAVSEAVEAILPFAQARAVSIRFDVVPELRVSADSLRLRQILNNLLSNAVKFTGSGGAVSVNAVKDGDTAKITVYDTGIGLGAEECSRIFDKFYQVDPRSGSADKGSGLGLSICRQLVEMQSGTIWVESVPGNGSQFHFNLPIAAVNSDQTNSNTKDTVAL